MSLHSFSPDVYCTNVCEGAEKGEKSSPSLWKTTKFYNPKLRLLFIFVPIIDSSLSFMRNLELLILITS